MKILRHPLQQKKYFFPSCSCGIARSSSSSIPHTGSTGMNARDQNSNLYICCRIGVFAYDAPPTAGNNDDCMLTIARNICANIE